MGDERILTPDQWAALRNVLASAGHANTVDAIAYELNRRARPQGDHYSAAAALLSQGATRLRQGA